MKKIAILGSTGSIGTQTLEVVRANKDIEVTALAAGSNIDLLEKQIREFSPKIAAVWNEEKAKELKDRVRDLDIRVESGMDGLLAVATELGAEIVVTAVVGMIGIQMWTRFGKQALAIPTGPLLQLLAAGWMTKVGCGSANVMDVTFKRR